MADTNASLGISTFPNICRQSHVPQAEFNRLRPLKRGGEWGQVYTDTVGGRTGVKETVAKSERSGGVVTFMRALPLACFFSSFFFRLTSPP